MRLRTSQDCAERLFILSLVSSVEAVWILISIRCRRKYYLYWNARSGMNLDIECIIAIGYPDEELRYNQVSYGSYGKTLI